MTESKPSRYQASRLIEAGNNAFVFRIGSNAERAWEIEVLRDDQSSWSN